MYVNTNYEYYGTRIHVHAFVTPTGYVVIHHYITP